MVHIKKILRKKKKTYFIMSVCMSLVKDSHKAGFQGAPSAGSLPVSLCPSSRPGLS